MRKRSDDPLDRVPGRVGPDVPIWFALLAPPIAGLAHLSFSFILENTACVGGSKLQLHVVSVVLMAVVVWAGLVARRKWQEYGSSAPKQLPGPLGSRRLMALLGMIGAFVFGLIILAQWFPNVVLGPCVRT